MTVMHMKQELYFSIDIERGLQYNVFLSFLLHHPCVFYGSLNYYFLYNF